MPSSSTTSTPITRVTAATREQLDDLVAIEEPLEIIAAWSAADGPREKTISVTMRTPGDDYDLAAGFLFTEGVIVAGSDIDTIRHWASPNRVRVSLKTNAKIETANLDRHFYTTSSCGVCGKTSIYAIRVASEPLPPAESLADDVIRALPAALHNAQSAFQTTGGVHGAAVVDRAGTVLRVREDIGRHNAVDKVIGSFIRGRALPPAGAILVVSSRASFELVQKAIVAKISTLVAIGGPSSLAIELAREFGLTLIGFVRDDRFNVYARGA
jgi:FdhD protein